ncbi:MAG: isoprenylcysteine carboxylmethyltransferase family protein [Parvibaculaceae bacterium]|nr:isoprenylcysteine carboxylmethyltransferase family protein [Parvibaculaceae bacterium]
MQKKSVWIRIGDFFFKYRNGVFPVIWCALFLSFRPAASGLHDWLAIGVVFLGLLIRAAVIGLAYIKRGGLNKRVYADDLVTEGLFTLCRNPLYVGNMVIYLGVFLMHGNPYVVGLGMIGCGAIYESIIAAEEYFLRQKFGSAYDAYCREVPRWLMRLDRLPNVMKGMRFNVRRVFLKDYSTMANAGLTLLFIDLLRHFQADDAAHFHRAALTHLSFIFSLLLLALCISLAKRKKLFGSI